MKFLWQKTEHDGSGGVCLQVEDKEDLFALDNLILEEDIVELVTVRNIKKSNESSLKAAKAEKKQLKLSIRVESVDFQPQDDSLRIKGKTTEQHPDCPLGSYHTAEVGIRTKLTVYKSEWDSHSFDIINKACSVEERAEVGAVVLEEGIAHICLITEYSTIIKTRVSIPIPKKQRGDTSRHDRSYARFIKTTAESAVRDLDLLGLKAVIIASPGFVGRDLLSAITLVIDQTGQKPLMHCKSKFVVAHSSTGYMQGLTEVLRAPEIQKKLIDTKCSQDVAILDEFFSELNNDTDRAWYGPAECQRAVEMGAVKALLLSDTKFSTVQDRKHFIELSDLVKAVGGDVYIFSSHHESGQQLNELTGQAVILKYPVPDLDEDPEVPQ